MDANRARELLAAERAGIERALPELRHQDAGDLSHTDLADGASDLTEDELDAGLAEQLRGGLAAGERGEAPLAARTVGR